jgi:hypothetical protein
VTDAVTRAEKIAFALEFIVNGEPRGQRERPVSTVVARARRARPSAARASHRSAKMDEAGDSYAPRSSEHTLLHRVVCEQLEPFLARARAR